MTDAAYCRFVPRKKVQPTLTISDGLNYIKTELY